MPIPARRLAVLVTVVALAGALGACGGPAPSAPLASRPAAPPATGGATSGSGQVASPSAGAPSPSRTAPLTPVPGGEATGPVGPGIPTTVTDWGTILDRVPDGFPVYPGAGEADVPDGPVSGAWLAEADVETVAGWYVSAFKELGWAGVDMGSALEDGTRVVDLASDLPECRAQATLRPEGGSTMISVLYGAGCAGGDG